MSQRTALRLRVCKFRRLRPEVVIWCGVQQEDVIVKVTSTAICGSDLHIYLKAMPGLKSGDILGHEVLPVSNCGPVRCNAWEVSE